MNFEIAPKSSEIQVNWYEANIYCSELKIDGKTGWRLPTKEELNQIYKSENDFVGNYYWTSTEFNGNYACIQYMTNGFHMNYGKSYGNYVRAVRTID
jgi:hypothetical protein